MLFEFLFWSFVGVLALFAAILIILLPFILLKIWIEEKLDQFFRNMESRRIQRAYDKVFKNPK